jgi:hypothetical protein
MKNFKFILIIIALLGAQSGFSQCRTFVKNNCRDAMGDYIPDENFNSAKLLAGDEAEVKMTFYSGQNYRLLICSHAVLGILEFQIQDIDGTIYFDNTQEGNTNFFDFQLEGTKELVIKIKVPDSKDKSLNPQGCVAIMVGRKIED